MSGLDEEGRRALRKVHLLASDFDQTLSFNDSGVVLSELLGTSGFDEKVAGLARINLVQQGGELAYLLLHDPEYRRVRRDHLVEVGRRIRLKHNIDRLAEHPGGRHRRPSLRVLRGLGRAGGGRAVGARRHRAARTTSTATRFRYDDATGEIESIVRVRGRLRQGGGARRAAARLGVSPDHVVYIGDGSSDIHVMLHVNRRDGLHDRGVGRRSTSPTSRGARS